MKYHDLDTMTGWDAELRDAEDRLFALEAGQRVVLRRPNYPTATVVVSEPWHLGPDGTGGECGHVSVSYLVKGGPEFSVTPYKLVVWGWVVYPAPAGCVFEVIG